VEGRLLSAVDPETGQPGGHVVIVDRMGVLARLYALADIAFIGGSLVPEGGHNPLEAAVFSKPVLFGPDMRDFLSISRMLVEGGGAVRVADEDALYREAAALLADPDAAARMGKQGRRIFETQAGAADRVAHLVVAAGNGSEKETAA
jgi:3-deoxy-D-manno-octulosonic-acid transferase